MRTRLGKLERGQALVVWMASGGRLLPVPPLTLSRQRLRRSVSAIAILAGLVQGGGDAARAQTLPTGGTVASGTATIGTPQAGTLTINQSSQRAVINWNAFSVGQGGTVTFQQPNANAATLNRVTGNTSSTIAGRIQSNGQVHLINPNGILITSTGTVDTGGFTASTLDSSDADFMAGRRRYTGTGQSAGVTNQGRIRVRGGGDAVLIGGRVSNEGTISAPGGRVGLASGERVSVDVEGDGFLTVSVPTSDSDRTRALISQTGRINARGGRVEARAATSADVARAAINLGGTIEAGGAAPTATGVRFGGAASGEPDRNRVAARPVTARNGDGRAARPARPPSNSDGVSTRAPRAGGTVVVDGGAGGRVNVTGRVNVSSPTLAGGSITVTGRAIDLSGARLDASGGTGGGQIRIGGDYQGTGSLLRADILTVDAATTIRADATVRGDGGRVILWSDQATSFAGMISAKGGALGGDGGFAEVSGKATLAFTGTADLRAAHGRFGTLLLDPYNVTISNDADANQTGFTATGNDSVINVTTLQNQLALSNVTISTGSGGTQAGDITVAAPIVWSSGSTLTLNAYRSIAVNANIFVTGAGGLSFNTNQGGTGGTLSFSLGSGVNYIGDPHTGQSLTINGNAYTLIYSVNELQAINANLTGRYALARPIDATDTRNWNGQLGFVALGMDMSSNVQNGGQGFTGTFEGLGNVIYNLSVRQIPTNKVGLFGHVGSAGTISNVGLRNVVISGQQMTGAIAGYNAGTITRVWADGRVDGTYVTGGLVGRNDGTISQSFSNAGVTADNGSMIGGLVGWNTGALRQVYATGATFGGNRVGALVGYMDSSGSIDQAFATGAVAHTSGATELGGLVGYSWSANITNAFFLTDTTGRGSGVGAGSGAGLGTAVSLTDFLNGGPRAGFAGGTGGIMPHLATFYPNGAEMISGTAYTDLGLTPLISAGRPSLNKNNAYVSTVIEGIEYGRVTTGINGFYMTLLPAGTLANGARVLTFTNADSGPNSSGSTNAGRYAVGTGASTLSGFDIYGNILTAQTPATLLSQASIDASGAAGSSPTGLAAIAGTTGRGYIATGSSFTVDAAQNLDAQSLFIRTANGATLTVAAAIDIRNAGKLALEAGGALAINANITAYGAATVSIANGAGYDYAFGNGATMSFYQANGGLFAPPPGLGTAYQSITQQYLTINGVKHWLVYSKWHLDEIDGYYAHSSAAIGTYVGTGGNFALAYNIDASNFQVHREALVRTFSGTLHGLGHTISNLNISSGDATVGLFGTVNGARIRDLGITGGNIVGSGSAVGSLVGFLQNGTLQNVHSYANVSGTGTSTLAGGLVGTMSDVSTVVASRAHGTVSSIYYAGGLVSTVSNGGLIADSYATGNVTSTGNHGIAGGLVAKASGQIVRSFATGTVTASGTGNSIAGGLAGELTPLGSITQSFALGATLGGHIAGGLVGWNRSVVSESFAAGAVISPGTAGGLIGTGAGPVVNSYYNAETTGAGGEGIGLTTLQLQTGGLASIGFDAGVWAGGTGGLYPYLKGAFPGGIQVVSGTAYRADGTTALASAIDGFVTVSLASGGAVRSTAVTGANGYYYMLMAPGTVSGSVVAYTTANATTGAENSASVRTAVTGNVSGLDIQNGWRSVTADSSLTSLSAVNAAFTSAAAGTAAAGMTFNNQAIDIAASMFSINQATTLSGTFALSGRFGTGVTQTAALNVGGMLLRGNAQFLMLNAGNQVGTIAADTPYLAYRGTGNLTIGSLSSWGTTTAGLVAGPTEGFNNITTTGDITIAANARVVSYAPFLSAGGAFINLRGADAVSATDRWVIYSASPTGNTFGGLDSGSTAVFGQDPTALGGTLAANPGNRYVFGATRTLTFTSVDTAKTYGDDVTAALQGRYTVTGFDPGITGVYLADTAATAFTGAALLTSGGTGTTANAGGSYGITIAQGALASTSGYGFSFVSAGNLTVAQRAITVTAEGHSRSYGDSNAPLTWQITSGNLVNSDSLTGGLATTADATSGVGTYAITQGSLANTNYAITYVGANLAVTQRAITVTADAQSRIYGNANPALTYTVGGQGLVNNDTLTGGLATDATATSNVGTYAITQGSLANANYAITYVGAHLAITQRAITVTADGHSRTYGDNNPTLSYTVGGLGLVNNDTLTGGLATDATATSNVGTYAITQGSLTNANYAITYVGANLAVTQRAITVTADAQSRHYGDSNPTLSYTVGGLGLAYGDTLSGTLATDADATSGVGTYAITQGTLANSNYAITYAGANLTVTARPITITAHDLSRIYGEANPELTFTVGGSGLVNGDSLTGSLAMAAGVTSGVGAYAITQGTLANANYTITGFSGASLTVTARPVTITAVDVTKNFGQADPALTYILGGMSLVNGDQITGGLTREAGEGVGSYSILQGTLAISPNYLVTFQPGRLTVNPVPAPVAIGQLATLFAPPPPPRTDATVLDGLFAAGVYCRPQPSGGLTCP